MSTPATCRHFPSTLALPTERSSKYVVISLSFISPPDFENPTDADHNNVYQVQVTADDGHGGQTVQTINVTVTDAADSSVFIDGSGNLVIGASAGQNDAYRLSYNGNIVLTATSGGPFFSSVGTGSGTNTLSIDPNSFSGRIIVNTGDGDDTLTVDTSLVAAGKNVDFNGGGGTDTLALTGSIDTQRYSFTNSSSGSVTLDPDGNIGASVGNHDQLHRPKPDQFDNCRIERRAELCRRRGNDCCYGCHRREDNGQFHARGNRNIPESLELLQAFRGQWRRYD